MLSVLVQIVYTCCLLPGRVYNVTYYMDFHPGGVAELMRGIGKDGTGLFSQVCPTMGITRNVQKPLCENHGEVACPHGDLALWRPTALLMLMLLPFVDTQLTGDSEIVRLSAISTGHSLPPRNIPGAHFC
jgi:hypothetical protein